MSAGRFAAALPSVDYDPPSRVIAGRFRWHVGGATRGSEVVDPLTSVVRHGSDLSSQSSPPARCAWSHSLVPPTDELPTGASDRHRAVVVWLRCVGLLTSRQEHRTCALCAPSSGAVSCEQHGIAKFGGVVLLRAGDHEVASPLPPTRVGMTIPRPRRPREPVAPVQVGREGNSTDRATRLSVVSVGLYNSTPSERAPAA